MKIGNRSLAEGVFIVAEIGNNHEGDFEVAQKLVRAAAESGVDAVKFQTFRTEHYVSRADTKRFGQLKSFELSPDHFRNLARLARSTGLAFLATPFDLASAKFLQEIVDAFKIASGDNNFYPLVAQVVRSGKPVIVSTGASNAAQVAKTVAFAKEQWAEYGKPEQLAILHCVSSYPVEPGQANLLSIPFLAQEFPEVIIGYSDHTVGTDAALLAMALGARLIEKHFTLDKHHSTFHDHQLSADPPEMRDLVHRLRQASSMLGTLDKVIQPCEKPLVAVIRRSIVAGADLPAGHRVRPSDLSWIRPAGGLEPGQEHVFIGKSLKRAVRFGERLGPADVQ